MTKPARGNCGTCHWFEPAGHQVNGEKQGTCCVNPPTPVAIMQQPPGASLRPQPAAPVPGALGMRPPTGENGRCRFHSEAGLLTWTGPGAGDAAQ